jgi:hypothetical protein
MVRLGRDRTGLWPAIIVMPKFKPVDATDLSAVAAQDALNTAVSGLLIGAVHAYAAAFLEMAPEGLHSRPDAFEFSVL